MITDRELIYATAQRKKEERLLYYAEFVGETVNKVLDYYGHTNIMDLEEEFGLYRLHGVDIPRKKDAPKFDYSKYFEDIEIPKNIRIEDNGTLNLPGSTHHFTHLISPLRNEFDYDEIMKFPIYRKPEYYDFSKMKEQTERLHKKGKAVGMMAGRLYELAWQLRGYENMLADMAIEPEIAEYFLGLEHSWNLETTKQMALADVDCIQFGDDVGSQKGMMFSPEIWRKMLKPKWAETFALAKSIKKDVVLWYHSCGDITPIIPDLIEIGLDILNPIQPECMDIYTIQKKYGDKLSFDGGLGTQTVLPFGTSTDVVNETTSLYETFGANGGFILSPSHIIEPEVPIENIDTFIRTAQKLCRR